MLSAVTILAAEAGHGEPTIHPYVVGGGTLVILLGLILALVAFGGGREHS